MKRLPLLLLLLVFGCGENPGPMATDAGDLGLSFEKGGQKNNLLTGDIDFVSGAAYLGATGQSLLWRRRVAEFAVKADGGGVYTYTRYASDGVTIAGAMKVDVMCAGSQGQFAAVAGPIVEASGIYEANVGVWYLGYAEDGGTPGVNGDRFRANYETSFEAQHGNNPGVLACNLVARLTDGDPENNTEPATWVVTRNGDGSPLDRSCSTDPHVYPDTWPDGVLDSADEREVDCVGLTDGVDGIADFPFWDTHWPDDPVGLSPAQDGNLRVH